MKPFLLAVAMCAALATALVVAFPYRAHAIEIDFGVPLLDQDDQPIKDGDKTLTLGRAAFVSLMAPQQDETNQPAEEKMRKGSLALKVYMNQPIDLGVEDLVLIKKYIAKSYGPLIVVRAYPLLDRSRK